MPPSTQPLRPPPLPHLGAKPQDEQEEEETSPETVRTLAETLVEICRVNAARRRRVTH